MDWSPEFLSTLRADTDLVVLYNHLVTRQSQSKLIAYIKQSKSNSKQEPGAGVRPGRDLPTLIFESSSPSSTAILLILQHTNTSAN
jgi:hypothetical protein